MDESRRVIESRTDGSVLAESIDPNAGEVIVEKFDETMADRISAMSQIAGFECDFRASAGSPTLALAQAASVREAIMIVDGTPDALFRGTLREFFSGSVAVNLAHRQHRPVLRRLTIEYCGAGRAHRAAAARPAETCAPIHPAWSPLPRPRDRARGLGSSKVSRRNLMNNHISSRHVVSHHPGEYISHGLDRAISLDTVRASVILDPRGFRP